MEVNSSKMTSEEIKQKTLELYNQLPQEREARKARTDIRDKIIELNYKSFGYIASHTFINNSSIDYEDKFQSALTHFCECWWWYQWEGDENHKGYRKDLSFLVFYKLRIGEMIERELNTVKYSLRRALCMEVGEQLGKHWGQVKYDDLADPRLHLPTDKMNSLKAIFGTLYQPDIEEFEPFLEAEEAVFGLNSDIDNRSTNYDSLYEFLIQEMIERERKLTDKDLIELSDMFYIPLQDLKEARPIAENMLHRELEERIAIKEEFNGQ